jgi:hypothetical protein
MCYSLSFRDRDKSMTDTEWVIASMIVSSFILLIIAYALDKIIGVRMKETKP